MFHQKAMVRLFSPTRLLPMWVSMLYTVTLKKTNCLQLCLSHTWQ